MTDPNQKYYEDFANENQQQGYRDFKSSKSSSNLKKRQLNRKSLISPKLQFQRCCKKYTPLIISLLIVIALLFTVDKFITNLNNFEINSNQPLEKKFTSLYQKRDQHFDQYINQQCPRLLNNGFHVYLNENDPDMKNLSGALKGRSQKCKIPILKQIDLQKMVGRWNNDQDQSIPQVKIKQLNSTEQKFLLIFLRLYFQGGTFIDIQQDLNKIHNRCYRYAIFGKDILFGFSSKYLDVGLLLPDPSKFIRVQYPFNPSIKKIIIQINSHGDILQQCQKKQCLIVHCHKNEGFIDQTQRQTIASRQLAPFPQIKSQQHHTFENDKQQYSLFSAINYNLALGVTNEDDVAKGKKNSLVLTYYQNSTSQKFKLKKVNNNKYKIINSASGFTIQVDQKSQKNLATIVLDKQKNDDSQLWEIIPLKFKSSNAFYIKSFANKLINVDGQHNEHGARVVQYSQLNEAINQIWLIQKSYKPELQSIKNYQQKVAILMQDTTKHAFENWLSIVYLRVKMKKEGKTLPDWFYQTQTGILNSDLPLYDEYANRTKIPSSIVKLPHSSFFVCPKNYTVVSVWIGKNQIPPQYQIMLDTCNQTVRLLNQKDFIYYSQKWNKMEENKKYLINQSQLRLEHKVDMTKLLYLYFESGIYADLDTQLNEQCFKNVYSDRLIFGGMNDWLAYDHMLIPEESFMMVKSKFNPEIRRMITLERQYHSRWEGCLEEQCMILNCQRHFKHHIIYKKQN